MKRRLSEIDDLIKYHNNEIFTDAEFSRKNHIEHDFLAQEIHQKEIKALQEEKITLLRAPLEQEKKKMGRFIFSRKKIERLVKIEIELNKIKR